MSATSRPATVRSAQSKARSVRPNCLAVITIVYSAAAAFAQRDLKRILAYSSINHLGYCLLGVFVVARYTSNEGVSALERTAALFESLHRLPPLQKRVLVLRFIEDQSLKETASRLGRSEGAIKQLQRRAIAKLRYWMMTDE